MENFGNVRGTNEPASQENFKPNEGNEQGGTELLVGAVLNEASQIEIRNEDKNERGELLVYPGGPVSNLGREGELYWKIVRTESFKKFFGDPNISGGSSIVVDENKEPMLLYRGVDKPLPLSEFYKKDYYYTERKSRIIGHGVAFTPDRETATCFTKDKENLSSSDGTQGQLLVGFINLRNPKYQETPVVDEVVTNIKNGISIFIPQKILPRFNQLSLSKHDGVFAGNESHPKSGSLTQKFSEHTDIQNLYQILLRDPAQVLLVPDQKKLPL